MALIAWNEYNGAGLNKLEYFTIQLRLVSNRLCLHASYGRWANAIYLCFLATKNLNTLYVIQ